MSTRWKFIAGGVVAAVAATTAGVALAGGGSQPACGCMPDVVDTAPPSSGPGPDEPSTDADGLITVTGTGTVSVDPDIATVSLGVEATAPTGAAAMEQVNASAAALTDALVASGIAEEDIQTSGLNLWSQTDEDNDVTGYYASLNLNVTVRDIEQVGPTIDAAQASAGDGFTIGGVSFSFDDPESVLEQARIDAIASARIKAEQYAAAAGLTLGPVVSITEQGATAPVQRLEMVPAAADQQAAGTPISPGQLDLDVSVSVTFATSS